MPSPKMTDHDARTESHSPLRSRSPANNAPSVRNRRSPQRQTAVEIQIRQEWRDLDCFGIHSFASAPWIVSPGIQAANRVVTQTRNFFSYTTKNTSNNFSAAVVAMNASNGEHLDCEFEIKVACGGILLGIASEDMPITSNWLEDGQCLERVWYYASPKGRFFNGPRELPTDGSPILKEAIRSGDRVKIEIDTKNHDAKFYICGTFFGKISFTCDTVRPAIFLFAKGSSVCLSSLKIRKLCTVGEEDVADKTDKKPVKVSSLLWTRCHSALSTRDSGDVLYNNSDMPTPAYSSLTRSEDGSGSCIAVLRYYASTKWTGSTCTGKTLNAEFEVKRRLGSMEFGVIDSSLPLCGTWCNRSYKSKAYWYSWSGALREGCELKVQTGQRFHTGDTVRIEIDLFLGKITFSVNNHAVGTLVVEAVDSIRRLQDSINAQKREILDEKSAINDMKKDILLGRFSQIPVVNAKIESLSKLQAALEIQSKRLPQIAETCHVELFPAVSMCCPDDSVLIDGEVALLAQETEPVDDLLVERQDIEKSMETVSAVLDADYTSVRDRVYDAFKASQSPLLLLLSGIDLDTLIDGYYRTLSPETVLRGVNGEEPKYVFVLVEGKLSVRIEGALTVKEIAVLDQKGATFGELAVTAKKGYKASVVAVNLCVVFQVSTPLLRKILTDRPEILANFQAQVKDRIHLNSNAGEAWRSMFLLHEQVQ